MAEKRIPTAVYVRTSDLSKDAIIDQIQIVELLTEANEKLSLKETYIDYGKSGLDMQRPAWKRLIEDCRKGKIKCITTTQLSVLGQVYAEDAEFFKETFTDLNVRVIAFLDGIDTDKPDFDFSRYYRKGRKLNFNDRVRTTQRIDMEQGKLANKPPYGFMKQDDELLIDHEKAEVVTQIYQWFLEGVRITEIAKRLTESSIKSPSGASKWGQTTVSRILRDRTYCGSYERGKRRRSGDKFIEIPKDDRFLFEDHHEGIVSTDDFEKVQILLDNHSKKADSERITTYPDEVDGLIFYASCGKKISYRRPGGDDGVKAGRYYCRYHTGSNPSGERMDIAPSITEQELKERLLLKCNERLQELRDVYRAIFSEPEETKAEEQQLIGEYRAQLFDRVMLTEKYAMKLIDEVEYNTIRKELYEAANNTRRALYDLRGRTLWDEMALERLHRFIVEVAAEDMQIFEGAKVRRLIDRIELKPNGMIDITFAKEKELKTVRKLRKITT